MTQVEFLEIFKEHKPAVFNYCKKVLNNTHDAEDITHNIFAKIWEFREQLTIDKVEGYLKKTTWHTCFDFARHVRIYRVDKYLLVEDAGDSVNNTDKRLFSNDIHKAIAQLPNQQHYLIKLRYLMGYNPAEISKLLHLSNSTVRNHLTRGLKNLRVLCKNQL